MTHSWRALAVFDLDGTLLRRWTACEVIAASHGWMPRMQELEQVIRSGDLRAAREEMAGWYRTAGTASLRASLAGACLAPGAEAGLALLRAHGVALAIASITWSFAVEHFAERLGVDHWVGTALTESGEIDHVWPTDKATWVRELARQLGVPPARTAAVGDSAGDLEMLRAVGVPVFVGREVPAAARGWLHYPDADIETVARHLLTVWQLMPRGDADQGRDD